MCDKQIEGAPHEILLVLYRQFDGYPEGVGADLKKALSPIEEVTYGLRMTRGADPGDTRVVVNGNQELPVWTIVRLKRLQAEHNAKRHDEMPDAFPKPQDGWSKGLYYVIPAKEADTDVVDFTYDISTTPDNQVHIAVHRKGWDESPDELLFEGPLHKFDPDEVQERAYPS